MADEFFLKPLTTMVKARLPGVESRIEHLVYHESHPEPDMEGVNFYFRDVMVSVGWIFGVDDVGITAATKKAVPRLIPPRHGRPGGAEKWDHVSVEPYEMAHDDFEALTTRVVLLLETL